MGSCYIATEVYGNPHAPQVEALRQFRDKVLMPSYLGKKFVDFYYSGAGERAANFLRDHMPEAKPVIKAGLDLLVENFQKSAHKN